MGTYVRDKRRIADHPPPACTAFGRPAARARRGGRAALRPLADALAILELIEGQDEARFEPAAVRWAGRLALEAPGLTLSQLHLAVEALDRLAEDEPRATLRALARRARPRPAAVARPAPPAQRRRWS
jgi:hypothetical protein